MPFDLDALQERLGGDRITEVFTEEIASAEAFSVKMLSAEQVGKLFPGTPLSDSEHVVYVPTRMCHSLPRRNKRGRSFFPQVIHRSAPSANDNLVDLDHILHKHGHNQDKVIGFIKAVRFDPEGLWDGKVELASSKFVMPKKAIPLFALMALFRRTKDGVDIIEQSLKGKRKWKSSMECVANITNSGFLYEGEYIEAASAPSAMIECVEKMKVRPYKGKELTLCLGGMNSTVDFCGIGMTPEPADNECDLVGFVTRPLRETASRKAALAVETISLNFPEEKRSEAIELASAQVEQVLEEQAAIQVIGQTNPSGTDNHVHDVLSNGMIISANGHTHVVREMQLVPGTNPRYTGITNDNDVYSENPSPGMPRYISHNHLIDISLRGKRNKTSAASAAADADATYTSTQASSREAADEEEVFTFEEAMNINAKLQEMEQRIAALGATPNQTELANVASLLREMRTSQEVATAITEGVKEKLDGGEYVTKAEHDRLVKEAADNAKKVADEEAKAREAQLAKTNNRITALTQLGVDVDSVEEGQTKSIRDIVTAIVSDDHWNSELGRHQAKVALTQKNAKDAAGTETTTQQASKPRPYLLNSAREEQANQGSRGGRPSPRGRTRGSATTQATNSSGIPAHFAGRKGFGDQQ